MLRVLAGVVAASVLLVASAPPAAAVPSAGPSPAAAVPGWVLPLAERPQVTRGFDPPSSPYGPGHRGVDLAGTPGDAVHSAGAGVVVFAGAVAGRPVVSIQHANGLRTTYEPVAPSLGAGAVVVRGAVVGTLLPGHAGCPAAACLHWGLRRGEVYLDPWLLLRPPRIRLLPGP